MVACHVGHLRPLGVRGVWCLSGVRSVSVGCPLDVTGVLLSAGAGGCGAMRWRALTCFIAKLTVLSGSPSY